MTEWSSSLIAPPGGKSGASGGNNVDWAALASQWAQQAANESQHNSFPTAQPPAKKSKQAVPAAISQPAVVAAPVPPGTEEAPPGEEEPANFNMNPSISEKKSKHTNSFVQQHPPGGPPHHQQGPPMNSQYPPMDYGNYPYYPPHPMHHPHGMPPSQYDYPPGPPPPHYYNSGPPSDYYPPPHHPTNSGYMYDRNAQPPNRTGPPPATYPPHHPPGGGGYDQEYMGSYGGPSSTPAPGRDNNIYQSNNDNNHHHSNRFDEPRHEPHGKRPHSPLSPSNAYEQNNVPAKKTMPLWIRQELERIEVEKQKKMERQPRTSLPDALDSQQNEVYDAVSSEDSSPLRKSFTARSRSSSPAPVKNGGDRGSESPVRRSPSPIMTEEEKEAALLKKTKQLLTEILLGVTNEEIYEVAKEVHAKASRHVPANLSRSSIGLAYEAGSDSDTQSRNASDDESENEAELRMKAEKKRKAYDKQTKREPSVVSSEESAVIESSGNNIKDSSRLDLPVTEKHHSNSKRSPSVSPVVERKPITSDHSFSKKKHEKNSSPSTPPRKKSPEQKSSKKSRRKSRSRSASKSDDTYDELNNSKNSKSAKKSYRHKEAYISSKSDPKSSRKSSNHKSRRQSSVDSRSRSPSTSKRRKSSVKSEKKKKKRKHRSRSRSVSVDSDVSTSPVASRSKPSSSKKGRDRSRSKSRDRKHSVDRSRSRSHGDHSSSKKKRKR